jgi:hypothetical protein
MSLRRHIISKLFALSFVVLIVLPFTAPFQTVDLLAPIGKTPVQALSSTGKSCKEVITPISAFHAVSLAVGVLVPVERVSSDESRQLRPIVLRL